jgi:DNA-binding transcriptional ArsR family regulator
MTYLPSRFCLPCGGLPQGIYEEIKVKKNLQDCQKLAEKLKAMAHPVRLCIVAGLIEDECNVSRIVECLGLPQATVSQHLRVLRSAGIIRGRRDGLRICYSVIDHDAVNLVRALLGE